MIRKRINRSEVIKDCKFSNSRSTGYGYLWWNFKKMNYMLGFLGQYMTIDRKNKIVAIRLLEAKWDNKKFEKATADDNLYFKNFNSLIEKL